MIMINRTIILDIRDSHGEFRSRMDIPGNCAQGKPVVSSMRTTEHYLIAVQLAYYTPMTTL